METEATFYQLDQILKRHHSTELWAETRHGDRPWKAWMGGVKSVQKYRNIYSIYRESSAPARKQIVEEVGQRMTAFQVVEKSLSGNSRPGKDRSTA